MHTRGSHEGLIRPFLTQSDSVNRKRPFSTGLFFYWILLALLIVSRVDFMVLVLFLETVGVRESCCMAVENQLAALCFARSPRAMRASHATNPRPSGLVALDFSQKPPKLRSWRCTQQRAVKATAGVAVVGKIAAIPRAAAVVRYSTRCWPERS